jgi:type II secretory pathway pseudopilin PulG
MCKPVSDEGYTLIALLALIALSGIAMATIAPTWSYLVTRDKEEELIFRGESYAFAIQRYQKEFNQLPTKLEEMYEKRFIRKLYKDPITGRDFELILQGPEGRKRESQLTKSQQQAVRGTVPGGSSLGIVGVVSTSDKLALRPWNNKERYNEWEFIAGEGDQQGGSSGGGEDDEGEGENDRDGGRMIEPPSSNAARGFMQDKK